jgi:hypothetical protein
MRHRRYPNKIPVEAFVPESMRRFHLSLDSKMAQTQEIRQLDLLANATES